MKIVQIGATYVGAQEKIEYAIHEFIKDKGHDSYILFAYGESNDKNIIKYESKWANLVRRALWKYCGKKQGSAFCSTSQLIRKLEKIRPDVVHLHVIHHGYIDYKRLLNYLAKRKIPVVYTMHDMWAFTGGCYHYSDLNCSGFMSDCIGCKKNAAEIDCGVKCTAVHLSNKIKLYKKLERIVFIAVSEWVHQELMKSKVKDYPSVTIWNAIVDSSSNEDNIFTSAEKRMLESIESDDSFKIVGVAAAWNSRKGVQRFFELATNLGNGYKIYLIGVASEEIRKAAPSNIVFLGRVNNKAFMSKCYSLANIHISMSLEETFGLTFVEAALAGTKSIGFDSTAITQVVQKVKGYVVEAGDVSEVARIVYLLKENKELVKMKDEEREEIRSEFSAIRMAEEYLKIYENMNRGDGNA